jgi:hypothetical protein
MGIARNLARLVPNGSGLLPNANIEAVAASKLTGTVADANAPSGSVIQVVKLNITSAVTFSSGSHATAYSISITPASASSKLLHIFWAKTAMNNSAAQAAHDYRVTRDGTPLWDASWQNYFNRTAVDTDHYPPCNFVQWDEPATTSSITYLFQGRLYGGNQGSWTVGDLNTNSALGYRGNWIIMEITG